MAQSIIANGESGASVRAKLNDRWQILAQSSGAVSCPADTTEDVLATITIPANAMGPNGRLRITTLWSNTNSGNTKSMRARLGGASGTLYMNVGVTASAALMDIRQISNRNAANSQVGSSTGTTGGLGVSGVAPITSAIDTTADTTLVLTGQKATSGETLTLESYLVELYYAA
jgi:hypothetical protein